VIMQAPTFHACLNAASGGSTNLKKKETDMKVTIEEECELAKRNLEKSPIRLGLLSIQQESRLLNRKR